MVKGYKNPMSFLWMFENICLMQRTIFASLINFPFIKYLSVCFLAPILEDNVAFTLNKCQNKTLGTEEKIIDIEGARNNDEGDNHWIRKGSESLRLLPNDFPL